MKALRRSCRRQAHATEEANRGQEQLCRTTRAAVENDVQREAPRARRGFGCSRGEDDDNGGKARDGNDRVARSEQLGGATRPSTSLRDGLLRAATGRGAGRASCGLHKHGKEQKKLRQQCKAPPDTRTVNQCRQVCVEKRPLTMRRAATCSGDSWGSQSRDDFEPRRDCSPEAETEHDRILSKSDRAWN